MLIAGIIAAVALLAVTIAWGSLIYRENPYI